MKEANLSLDHVFVRFLNFLSRNPLTYGLLDGWVLERHVRDLKDDAYIHGCLLSHAQYYTDDDDKEFMVTAKAILKKLQYGFSHICFHAEEIRALAEYKDKNIKMEILTVLKSRKDRRDLSNLAYRRSISRALKELERLGLIIWWKRKRIELTEKGLRLQKTITQAYHIWSDYRREHLYLWNPRTHTWEVMRANT